MEPDNQTNGSGSSRLDRLEGLMNLLIEDHVKFQDEHKSLLMAQVVLTDRVDKLTISVQQFHMDTEAIIQELREARKHNDDRLNALINVVDDIVRKRPPGTV